MITCTITNDSGLHYTSDTIADAVSQLHNYLKEEYGKYTVFNTRTESIYANCTIITSLGTYIINTKNKELCVLVEQH